MLRRIVWILVMILVAACGTIATPLYEQVADDHGAEVAHGDDHAEATSEVTAEAASEVTAEVTEVLPTAVEIVPSATPTMVPTTVPPTATSVEPTATSTPVPTTVPPTATSLPTEVPPTATLVEPTAVPTQVSEVQPTESASTSDTALAFTPISAADDPMAFFIEFANAAEGQALFNQNFETSIGVWQCTLCHNIEGDTVKIGPSLWGIGDRANQRVEGEGPYTYLYNAIFNSQAYVVPGFEGMTQMPLYGTNAQGERILSDTQIYNLIAYLMTLR